MKKLLILPVVFLLFFGCKKEDDQPDPPSFRYSGHLVWLANEGMFQGGTGTISGINLSTGQEVHEIFENTNGFGVGNVLQSLCYHDDQIYAVVNNAQKIEVMQYPGFVSTGTISGLEFPRYMEVYNEIGFVSDWTVGGVQVIDLSSNSVESVIETGAGAENLLIHNEKLYVANSGGFGTDNRVSVIDCASSTLLTQIEVGDNPQSLVMGADGNMRVLCRGVQDWQQPENDTPGSLFVIDPNQDNVVGSFNFTEATEHPSNLVVDGAGNTLFFLLNSAIYKMDADATEFPSEPLVSGNFYGLGFHPEAQSLLATDAGTFDSDGTLNVFSPEGEEQTVFDTGIAPNFLLPL